MRTVLIVLVGPDNLFSKKAQFLLILFGWSCLVLAFFLRSAEISCVVFPLLALDDYRPEASLLFMEIHFSHKVKYTF